MAKNVLIKIALDQSPRSLVALAEETGISSDTLYGYLKGFLRVGIVSRYMQGKAYLFSFNYIVWPELSIQEVFIHSLYSAGEMQQKLFCVLFYLKNRDKLKAIDHPMMKYLKAVLLGERIRGYSTMEDIEDRTDLYDIKL